MKTAISVPDATYERVTRRARELGMSRSELFSVAADHFLDEIDRRSLTHRIDEALAVVGTDDAGAVAVQRGHRTLAQNEW